MESIDDLSVVATERILETMLELKRQGVAPVIISHRLTDIFAVGDRVMVLKGGENVGDRYVRNTDEHEVLEIIASGTRETALMRADRTVAYVISEHDMRELVDLRKRREAASRWYSQYRSQVAAEAQGDASALTDADVNHLVHGLR